MKPILLDRLGWLPVIVVLLVAALPETARSAPLFPNPGYATGPNPWGLAMADLDEDGIQDLVASNLGIFYDSPGSISIYYGRSDGTFANEIRRPTLVQPLDVLTADINSDGRPDLVLSSNTKPSILLNRGGGVLGPETLINSSVSFPTVQVGDFDGDKKPDLFVLGVAYQVLFGRGDGTFRPGPVVAPGLHVDVVVADVDEDRKSDLLFIPYDPGSYKNQLQILSSRGDGTFKKMFTLDTDEYFAKPMPADLDSDGHLDLGIGTCASYGNYCDPGPLRLAFGRGDGSFEAGPAAADRLLVNSVAACDLDLDGQTDFLDTTWWIGTLAIHRGLGNRTFAAPQELYVGQEPARVLCHDFDANGMPDMAVLANRAEAVLTYFGNGNGTFGPQPIPSYFTTLFNAAAVGDFNADGKLDLAAGSFDGNEFDVHLGNGDGTFQPVTAFLTGNSPTAIAATDLNGDGRLDLAVCANEWHDHRPTPAPPGTLSIHLGDGLGGFQRGPTYQTGPGPYALARGDFNDDSVPDLFVLNGFGGYGGETPFASLFVGSGGGAFTPAPPIEVGAYASDVAVADFNRDGHADLALSSRGHYSNVPPFGHIDGNVSIYLGRGNGTFGAAVLVGSLYSVAGVAAADLNGDGKVDLAAADEGMTSVAQRGGLKLFLGNGSGQFLPGAAHLAGVGPQDVRAADFNGDGIRDLATPNAGGDESVLLGLGGGAFAPEARFGLLGDSIFLVEGDFNGDLVLDSVVLSAPNEQNVSKIVNTTVRLPR